MTMFLFGMHLSFNFRNGVGLDIEAATARPIWITDSVNNSRFAVLDGIVICLPLCVVTYGVILEEEA